MNITGYVDRWSAHPGDTLKFYVSCTRSSYNVELRRLIHGDANPNGPGIKEVLIQSLPGEQIFDGKLQEVCKGSCVVVSNVAADNLVLLTGCFLATRTESDVDQSIATFQWAQVRLSLKLRAGILILDSFSDDEERVLGTGKKPVADNVWYRFALKVDLEAGIFDVYFCRVDPYPFDAATQHLFGDIGHEAITGQGSLLFGAESADQIGRQWHVRNSFNGKIADLQFFSNGINSKEVLGAWLDSRPQANPSAAWDFVEKCETSTLPDSCGKLDGLVINRPTRLVTGPKFSGQTIDPFIAPDLFNAAHFHDDDLENVGWDESFSYLVPVDLPSGIYAFKLICDEGEDYIPFFVSPAVGEEKTKVAVLLPTFSYQVYANMHMDVSVLPEEIVPLADRLSAISPEEDYVTQNGLYSCYDRHSDGSGVCMATNQRPMPIFVRPRSSNRFNGGQHLLGADLFLIDWLEEKDIPYEIVTDHDLHFRGVNALSSYATVLSGSHAEYWSSAMLDALKSYQNEGGRFVYLSGNGLYWVAEPNEDGSLIEIRRDQGLRTWDSAPGEAYISLSKTRGGTWRHHGRAPQKFVGVGQSAMGLDNGRPYNRTDASYHSRAAFLFEGIDDDLIGDFRGLVSGYGAAGVEIDRAALDLGTPSHALVLATASGFSDAYQLDIQDIGASTPYFGGTTNENVRADIVFFETPNNGAVFSVGSIAWCSALSYNQYDNTVSRLTENVIRSFIRSKNEALTSFDESSEIYA
ncbi:MULTISPECIES: N,N-dimethylformamidase beta subunit family domain-containing protein [Paraburkholderia]|uniref:N,N-dimethylformamidase beta subunit-like C-terminal domain-containing protein n=1 Tax=Paraburkholderia metrosideri TaxID=580937 RepID=A0ABW9E335_9BURK